MTAEQPQSEPAVLYVIFCDGCQRRDLHLQRNAPMLVNISDQIACKRFSWSVAGLDAIKSSL